MSLAEQLPPEGFRQRGPLPTGTRLVFIRHGECVANERGLAGGPIGDGGLTELGRAQARALARRLAITKELHGARAFYTSMLPRAIETGAIVFGVINPDLAPRREEDLGELRVGVADALTWSEIEERYELPDWNTDPGRRNVPGGESLIEFHARCVAIIDQIVARHPNELVVIVSHGGVIEQAMKIYQGLDASVRLRPRIEHLSMTEIEFHDGATRLLRYNDLSPIGVE
ncbi:MAG: histidine phosphatase family protein [Acidimicrobiales bacterium]